MSWTDGMKMDGADDDGEGGVDGWAEDDVAGGDDAVVEYVFDAGEGGEVMANYGILLDDGCSASWGQGREGAVDDSEAETIITLQDLGADGAGASLGVPGNRGVAIDDEIAVRDDGVRIYLRGEREWGQ